MSSSRIAYVTGAGGTGTAALANLLARRGYGPYLRDRPYLRYGHASLFGEGSPPLISGRSGDLLRSKLESLITSESIVVLVGHGCDYSWDFTGAHTLAALKQKGVESFHQTDGLVNAFLVDRATEICSELAITNPYQRPDSGLPILRIAHKESDYPKQAVEEQKGCSDLFSYAYRQFSKPATVNPITISILAIVYKEESQKKLEQRIAARIQKQQRKILRLIQRLLAGSTAGYLTRKFSLQRIRSWVAWVWGYLGVFPSKAKEAETLRTAHRAITARHPVHHPGRPHRTFGRPPLRLPWQGIHSLLSTFPPHELRSSPPRLPMSVGFAAGG